MNIPNHGLIFPSLTASSFGRKLKSEMIRMGHRSGASFSSHCFRRGATQELQVAEASTDTIKSAGCWRGMGFRSYVDTQLTDALKIPRLLVRATASDSDDDPDAPANLAMGAPLRKKLRGFPGSEL